MKSCLLFSILLFFGASSLNAQQQLEHPGISLYKQGKYSEAVSVLSSAVKDNAWKANGSLWNYLGLAYIGVHDYKKAKKAVQMATELDPGNSVYRTNLAYLYLESGAESKAVNEANSAISLDSSNVAALYVRGSAYLRSLRTDAAEKDAEQMMKMDPADGRGYVLASSVKLARFQQVVTDDSEGPIREHASFVVEAHNLLQRGADSAKTEENKKIVDDELRSIEPFYEYLTKEPVKPGTAPDPTVTPLKMISKPFAHYTDQARSNQIQGTILAAVLLGADGKVQGVMLLRRLGYGLDQEAIRAARAIKFEPKMKDGHPVSVVKLIEYNFNIR